MSRSHGTDPAQIAIVTVHGTGDTAPGPDGDKWFQRGSAFTAKLIERLAAQGITAEIVPHLWSGANSARGREDGARSLSRTIRRTAKEKGAVHVIGHSHGGNVADQAASMLGWRLRKRARPQIAGVTTVGTPFFKTQLGPAEAFGGIAFLAIVAISILALALMALVLPFMLQEAHLDVGRYTQDCIASQQAVGEGASPGAIAQCVRAKLSDAKETRSYVTVLLWLVPVSAIALFLIVPLAVQGALRILRIVRRQHPDAQLFSIYHPNDEAIAFLQRVEELPIEPFPRWSFWRRSRTSGIVWGVRAVVVVFLGAVAAWIAHLSGVRLNDENYAAFGRSLGFDGKEVFGGLSTADLALTLFVIAVLGAPLLFSIAYGIGRAGPLLLEFLGRGAANRSIADALRGMAFGRDGDEKLGAISTHSHTYGTRPFVVEGDLGERMRAGAATAAAALIEKYRWALFTVGPDTNGAISRLSTDAMTWDSLIHTTYFDQPEMAHLIADYIAECVNKERGAHG